MCTVLVNEMARRNLLQQMEHLRIDQNVSQTGCVSGSSACVTFPRGTRRRPIGMKRGYEQGAEIMAWALGTRLLTAQIPGNDPGQLEAGFDLLTGVHLER